VGVFRQQYSCLFCGRPSNSEGFFFCAFSPFRAEKGRRVRISDNLIPPWKAFCKKRFSFFFFPSFGTNGGFLRSSQTKRVRRHPLAIDPKRVGGVFSLLPLLLLYSCCPFAGIFSKSFSDHGAIPFPRPSFLRLTPPSSLLFFFCSARRTDMHMSFFERFFFRSSRSPSLSPFFIGEMGSYRFLFYALFRKRT